MSKPIDILGKKFGRLITINHVSKSHKGKTFSKERIAKMSKTRKGKYLGSKGCNWRGGLTSVYDSIRTSAKYYDWRNEVYSRDSYTCQHCGDFKGGNLNAHHIVSFSTLLENHKVDTIDKAQNCSALWDTDNGITYCKECHKLTKQKGGKLEGDNTYVFRSITDSPGALQGVWSSSDLFSAIPSNLLVFIKETNHSTRAKC